MSKPEQPAHILTLMQQVEELQAEVARLVCVLDTGVGKDALMGFLAGEDRAEAAEAKLERVLGLLQIEADKPENDTVRSRFKAIIREAREL